MSVGAFAFITITLFMIHEFDEIIFGASPGSGVSSQSGAAVSNCRPSLASCCRRNSEEEARTIGGAVFINRIKILTFQAADYIMARLCQTLF